MRLAVILCCDKTMLNIPASWCSYIDVVNSYNSGLNRNIVRRIFFSPDENVIPNWNLQLRTNFDENYDACYLARVIRAFGSDEEANKYIHRKRHIQPGVYNPNRLRQTVPRVVENLPLDVKTTIKLELEPLRKAINYAHSIIGVQDLTEDDSEEFAEIFEIQDDDDDDGNNNSDGIQNLLFSDDDDDGDLYHENIDEPNTLHLSNEVSC